MASVIGITSESKSIGRGRAIGIKIFSAYEYQIHPRKKDGIPIYKRTGDPLLQRTGQVLSAKFKQEVSELAALAGTRLDLQAKHNRTTKD